MRTSWIVILGCVAVALAGSGCGGKSIGGDLGDAGDDGGASGSGSGGGSGGSSGSGSSSGGGSSSSSGGGSCPATPGQGTCSSGEQCTYGSGCGQTFCSCSTSGQWQCGVPDCPPPPPVCPQQWPQDLPCGNPGSTCDYPTGGGSCGSTCTCEAYGSDGGSYAWSCVSPPCPPPSCPPVPPQTGDACSSVNASCDYTPGLCAVNCVCEPSGTWSCAEGLCIDAGPIDAGTGGG
jgi:hypothetical protein